MEQVGAGESSRLRAMGRRRPSLWCEGAALGGFTCSPTPPHPSGGPAAQVSPVLCLRGQCLRAPPTRLLLWGVPCPIETPTPQRFRAPCAEGFCGHSWAQTPGNEQFSAGSDCKVGRPSPGSITCFLHISQEKYMSLYSWFGLVLPASFVSIYNRLSYHIVGY